MAAGSPARTERRAREHNATRASILDAARRVAARDGARNLSLRATAAEAGFAPAALYGYFQSKNDLLLALAADDLSGLARAMRSAAGTQEGPGRLAAAAGAALSLLQGSETFAAAPSALPSSSGTSDAERLFNGRMIAALNALSDATGQRAESRQSQADVLLLAASLTGLALLARSGRLAALGFAAEELLVRLDARFTNSI